MGSGNLPPPFPATVISIEELRSHSEQFRCSVLGGYLNYNLEHITIIKKFKLHHLYMYVYFQNNI